MDLLPRLHFADRADAGRQLARKLAASLLDRPVIYALPRGGVPVALEIARALHAPLDLILVRKIGAPDAPEVALGAVADGENPHTVINEDVRQLSHAGKDFIDRATQHELAEIERRRARYFGERARIDPSGRTAIVVDDGLATGATARAALAVMKRQGAAKTILAVPVAPAEVLAELRGDADEIICLHPARVFRAVGTFYDDFHQLTDGETVELLREAWDEAAAAPPAAGKAPGGEDEIYPLDL